jgi:hypothetical protein
VRPRDRRGPSERDQRPDPDLRRGPVRGCGDRGQVAGAIGPSRSWQPMPSSRSRPDAW